MKALSVANINKHGSDSTITSARTRFRSRTWCMNAMIIKRLCENLVGSARRRCVCGSIVGRILQRSVYDSIRFDSIRSDVIQSCQWISLTIKCVRFIWSAIQSIFKSIATKTYAIYAHFSHSVSEIFISYLEFSKLFNCDSCFSYACSAGGIGKYLTRQIHSAAWNMSGKTIELQNLNTDSK